MRHGRAAPGSRIWILCLVDRSSKVPIANLCLHPCTGRLRNGSARSSSAAGRWLIVTCVRGTGWCWPGSRRGMRQLGTVRVAACSSGGSRGAW